MRVNLSTNGVKKIRKSFEDPRVFFSILGLTVERLFKPFTFLVLSLKHPSFKSSKYTRCRNITNWDDFKKIILIGLYGY